MKSDVDAILAKEVDRRDFLKHVGLAIVAATGIGAVIKSVNSATTKNQVSGFGAGAYGGPRSS